MGQARPAFTADCVKQGSVMANQAPIRILAVDDHALLRKGIRMLISTESDMQLVAEASTGREALQEFRTHRPDITLMDLQMPDMGGVEAIIAIRGEFPNGRVIVLTTYAGDAQVLRALNAGARGYLLKGKINTELLETIRAVHAGQKRISAEVAAELARACRRGGIERTRTASASPHRQRKRQQRDRCSACPSARIP